MKFKIWHAGHVILILEMKLSNFAVGEKKIYIISRYLVMYFFFLQSFCLMFIYCYPQRGNKM